jgi:transcription elongation factor GreB
MSKAFTRESDETEDDAIPPRPSSTLPPGAKNYLTPDGAERLRAELHRLQNEERPQIAASPETDGDRKKTLQRIDQRIQQLEDSLSTAVITPPPSSSDERNQVHFGATVTVRRKGGEVTYRIVGVDEADPDRLWVSWPSPIARALLQKRLGERVHFKFPSGEEELEILRISYEDAGEL